MPDYSMCSSECCYRSTDCRRHPDSGTIPNPKRQAWGAFDEALYWDADQCRYFVPVEYNENGENIDG